MRQFTLFLLSLIAATAVHAEVIDIDDGELARLQAAGVAVVDVRTSPEWEETGVLPGSHLLTFFDARGQAEPEAWLKKLSAIAAADQPVVLICRSGRRSAAVSRLLSEQAGYAKVYNVKGGIVGWLDGAHPVVATTQAASTCDKASTC